MNASRSFPLLNPVEPPRRSASRPSALNPSAPNLPAAHPRRVRQSQTHTTIALELLAKLTVNILIGATAYAALSRLLPYNLFQQQKLQEIRTEVSTIQGRMGYLKADFGRHFDPQQAMSIMQEQSSRVAPGQRKIVWTETPDGP